MLGRADDVIISGGENVARSVVEQVLEQHPDVAEAAVHGRPDERWGQAVVATIVPRPGARRRRAATCSPSAATRLAPWEVPKALHVVDELPRTASGKLLRRAL